MVSVCFYFQVHQPFRLRKFSVFEVGRPAGYFEENTQSNIDNKKIFRKVADKCYLPANKVLLDLLKGNPRFKVSFSLSGVFLEQCEKYGLDVLASFQELVKTGQVELIEETYYHSLSFLYSKKEFREQVKLHSDKIKKLFGLTPKVFRNTELIYNDSLAKEVESMGYKGIITEGADHILGWRSPNFVYQPEGTSKIGLLLKNYRLSDDIAFRFSNKGWEDWPLTAPKFAHWVNAVNGSGQVINLFMDYETFGEHQWVDTGIFDFMRHLPYEILKHPDNNFKTPSEVLESYSPISPLSIPNFISWADIERDLSAWKSNAMQDSALAEAYSLEKDVRSMNDKELLHIWRKLQTSDHFYYMCTKWFADGDVHKYFNPYDSPYDAFIAYMNILSDVKWKLNDMKKKLYKQKQSLTLRNNKEEVSEMDNNIPKEKYFWFNDGTAVKNLQEMHHAFIAMSPETYSYHVNGEKNDFVNWVRDVLKEEQLAIQLKGITSKEEAAAVIRKKAFPAAKKEQIKIKNLPSPNEIAQKKANKKEILSQLRKDWHG